MIYYTIKKCKRSYFKQFSVEILQFVPHCLDQLRNPQIKRSINLLHNRNLIVSTDDFRIVHWCI